MPCDTCDCMRRNPQLFIFKSQGSIQSSKLLTYLADMVRSQLQSSHVVPCLLLLRSLVPSFKAGMPCIVQLGASPYEQQCSFLACRL
jgi:hypothetical protein